VLQQLQVTDFLWDRTCTYQNVFNGVISGVELQTLHLATTAKHQFLLEFDLPIGCNSKTFVVTTANFRFVLVFPVNQSEFIILLDISGDIHLCYLPIGCSQA
jgi:hypothetical protein